MVYIEAYTRISRWIDFPLVILIDQSLESSIRHRVATAFDRVGEGDGVQYSHKHRFRMGKQRELVFLQTGYQIYFYYVY